MPKPSIKTLNNKLDRLFSQYVRLRDADGEGYVLCCTCGVMYHWSDVDAGHFLPRRNIWTRWLPSNCHSQCRACNRGGSVQVDYMQFMLRTYNENIIRLIDILHHTPDRRNTYEKIEWRLALIEWYEEQLKELEWKK